MASRVRDVDRGWRKIAARFKRAPNIRVRVGVQGPAGEAEREGGITNAGLAAVHEFGSPTRGIPQRSFLGSTFDEKQSGYQKEIDRLAGASLDGNTLEGEMRLLGETYRKDVLDKINSNIPPPLTAQTVARKKGEATALVASGQLRNSLSVVVEKVTK